MRKEIVSLILYKKGRVLVEKRKQSKRTNPGSIIFPAGHVEPGESKEEALKREMYEELGIKIVDPKLVYEADLDAEDKERIFWYSCESYSGKVTNKGEAERLLWLDGSQLNLLTHQVSRDAFLAYLRFL